MQAFDSWLSKNSTGKLKKITRVIFMASYQYSTRIAIEYNKQ